MKNYYLFDESGENIEIKQSKDLIQVSIVGNCRFFTVKQFKKQIEELNNYLKKWCKDETK